MRTTLEIHVVISLIKKQRVVDKNFDEYIKVIQGLQKSVKIRVILTEIKLSSI